MQLDLDKSQSPSSQCHVNSVSLPFLPSVLCALFTETEASKGTSFPPSFFSPRGVKVWICSYSTVCCVRWVVVWYTHDPLCCSFRAALPSCSAHPLAPPLLCSSFVSTHLLAASPAVSSPPLLCSSSGSFLCLHSSPAPLESGSGQHHRHH